MADGIGRPSIYTPELATEICTRMADGRSLRSVCRDEDMPGLTTVVRWFKEADKEDFRAQYAQAREAMADAMAEEAIDLSDDVAPEPGPVGKARLQVDTRKWFLSKVAAKKYGDKLAIGGDKDADPIKVETSLSEAARAIAFMFAAAAKKD